MSAALITLIDCGVSTIGVALFVPDDAIVVAFSPVTTITP
jgi:hypothetical protein